MFDFLSHPNFWKIVVIPIISGGVAAAVVGYYKDGRQHRKEMVASAYKIALARVEALYMIRRRSVDVALRSKEEADIRDHIHQIQEDTDYYIGLLKIESAWFGEEYEKFVAKVKQETAPLLQEAWTREPTGPGVRLAEDSHPDISLAREAFLVESRNFFNPFRRFGRRIEYSRNRKGKL